MDNGNNLFQPAASSPSSAAGTQQQADQLIKQLALQEEYIQVLPPLVTLYSTGTWYPAFFGDIFYDLARIEFVSDTD